MDINPRSHFQFELFPGSVQKTVDVESRRPLLKDLTLSPENIIVLCIVFVMSLVLFFAFGVERGRRIVQASLPAVVGQNNVKAPLLQKQAIQLRPVTVNPQGRMLPSNTTIKQPSVGSVNVQPGTVPVQPVSVPMESLRQQMIDAGYTIQVASFKSPQSAKNEAMNLKSKGYEIFVIPKGSHSIVCVGKFLGMEEAKRFADRLKGRYKDCLVRRL